jgi:hypothetical protein
MSGPRLCGKLNCPETELDHPLSGSQVGRFLSEMF